MTPRRKPSNPIETSFKKAVIKVAQQGAKSYASDTTQVTKGILINRDPPKRSGWCGNENCEHLSCKSYSQPAVAA